MVNICKEIRKCGILPEVKDGKNSQKRLQMREAILETVRLPYKKSLSKNKTFRKSFGRTQNYLIQNTRVFLIFHQAEVIC